MSNEQDTVDGSGSAEPSVASPMDTGALLHLHLNEYQALTTRATYYIVMSSAIWPLIFALLTILVSFVTSLSPDAKVEWSFPIVVWGGGFGAQLALVIWTFLVCEQYKIVLYVEKYLRPTVYDIVGTKHFWMFEPMLRDRGKAWLSKWKELQTELTVLILFVGVFFVRVFRFQKFTSWDWVGAVSNGMILVVLVRQSVVLARIRHEWESAGLTPERSDESV